MFIDPRWNVYPCSMYDAPLGSLRERDFDLDGLWHEERTRALQREIASATSSGPPGAPIARIPDSAPGGAATIPYGAT